MRRLLMPSSVTGSIIMDTAVEVATIGMRSIYKREGGSLITGEFLNVDQTLTYWRKLLDEGHDLCQKAMDQQEATNGTVYQQHLDQTLRGRLRRRSDGMVRQR